jgi:hypothetical protein
MNWTAERVNEYCALHGQNIVTYDEYASAFMGLIQQFDTLVALYDYEKSIRATMQNERVSYPHAKEMIDFNVLTENHGQYTPAFYVKPEI